MELAGDEKKIQALFSDLSVRDRSAAPAFDELWLSATMQRPAPVRGRSKPLLVVIVALLIAATGAWSWYRSKRSFYQQVANASPQTISTAPAQVVQQTTQVPATTPPSFRPGRQKKPARIRQPERPAIAEAALLSRWQSPTQTFMKSPAAIDLNSLPQLNQSLEQLKQFLPRHTEPTKESNQ